MNDIEDLVQWLRVQLDEDERVARAATCEAWRVTGELNHPCTQDGEIHTVAVHARWEGDKNPEPYQVVTHGDFHEAVARPDAEHIARHDPARVLREVEAKRRIIDDIARYAADGEGWEAGSPDTDGLAPRTLALLALPYASRPGYREEWRP